MDSTPIIHNFTDSCLIDLQNKHHYLQTLQDQAIANLQQQATNRIDYVSRVFVALEDQVVKYLREKIKILFQHQQRLIEQNLQAFQKEVTSRIRDQEEEYLQIKSKIESQSPEAKKWLGKFAQGKMQKNFQSFQKELLQLQIPSEDLQYDEEELKDLIGDIIDLLNIKYRVESPVAIVNPSALATYSRLSALSRNTINETPEEHDQAVSRIISEQEEENEQNEEKVKMMGQITEQRNDGDSAIIDFRQTKTIKKKHKLESQIKREKYEGKSLSVLAHLALERQRILKELG